MHLRLFYALNIYLLTYLLNSGRMAFACLLLRSVVTNPHCESTMWLHKQASGIVKVLC